MKLNLRTDLQWFAGQMELTLRDNDHKSGWHDPDEFSMKVAMQMLRAEVEELQGQVDKVRYGEGDADRMWIVKEATDVANFAMMVADRARRMLQ